MASQGTITTRSATKAAVLASAAPTPTVVGSPSVLPAPSHSAATAPAFTRKRKALAAATSVTFAEGTSTYTLIENVYMGTSWSISIRPRPPTKPSSELKSSLSR